MIQVELAKSVRGRYAVFSRGGMLRQVEDLGTVADLLAVLRFLRGDDADYPAPKIELTARRVLVVEVEGALPEWSPLEQPGEALTAWLLWAGYDTATIRMSP